jgi:hypothetical protein
MLTEPHFTAGVAERLDVMLSQYLQANRGEPHPLACPPWRNQGRQTVGQDHASFNADDVRGSSGIAPALSYGIGHFD